MKQCSTCQYQLEPFESTCPRCERNASKKSPSSVNVQDASALTITRGSVKAVASTAPAPSAPEFNWLPGAVAAGATFLVPAFIFAVFNAIVADVPKRRGPDSFWLDTIICFAPWLGGIGGYMASAYNRFWHGVAAGVAFSILWCFLCRSLGGAMSAGATSNVDFTLYMAIFSLVAYDSVAIFAGVKRGQNGLTPVDGSAALALFLAVLCFAFPVGGIIVTTLLRRSDSDYSQPCLISTLLGIGLWALIFLVPLLLAELQ